MQFMNMHCECCIPSLVSYFADCIVTVHVFASERSSSYSAQRIKEQCIKTVLSKNIYTVLHYTILNAQCTAKISSFQQRMNYKHPLHWETHGNILP
jgi:hypothetical protein